MIFLGENKCPKGIACDGKTESSSITYFTLAFEIITSEYSKKILDLVFNSEEISVKKSDKYYSNTIKDGFLVFSLEKI